MPSVLTTPKPNPVSSNPARNARLMCAAPLLLVFLVDWTRAGEALEGLGGWLVLALPIAAGAAKLLKNTDPRMLRLVLTRAAKIAAGVLVGTAVQKGWLTPDAQNETTARLTEIFIDLGLLVAGAVWVHKDTKREIKAVATEQQRTEIALNLPAGSSIHEVEAIRLRDQQIAADKAALQTIGNENRGTERE